VCLYLLYARSPTFHVEGKKILEVENKKVQAGSQNVKCLSLDRLLGPAPKCPAAQSESVCASVSAFECSHSLQDTRTLRGFDFYTKCLMKSRFASAPVMLGENETNSKRNEFVSTGA
jgi:hypothetical protein